MFGTKRRERQRQREAAGAAVTEARARIIDLEAAHRLAEAERVGQVRELRGLALTLTAAINAPLVDPRLAGRRARAQLELEQVEAALAELGTPIEPSVELRAARDALRRAEAALREVA